MDHLSTVPHASAATLPPNTRVLGRYHLLEPIGRGAFSTVYRARDPVLSREVAVKLYAPGVHIQVSQQEIALQSQCQHPNLMPLYDAGTDPQMGRAFVVMPLFPGMDLERYVQAHGSLSLKRAVLVADQICGALELLWRRRQAIHGDVKPANIWMTSEGTAVLMDFNLRGHLLAGGSLHAGTPGYTAPEVAYGRRDQRSDVYSLGCVLYRMVTGSAPDPLTPPSRLRDGVAGPLDEVIMTAMAPNPDDRYPSAIAFRDALRQARYALHPLATRVRGFLRRPAATLAGGLVVALTAGVALLAPADSTASATLLASWILCAATAAGLSLIQGASWEVCYLTLICPGAWRGRLSGLRILLPVGMALAGLTAASYARQAPWAPVLLALAWWSLALPMAVRAHDRAHWTAPLAVAKLPLGVGLALLFTDARHLADAVAVAASALWGTTLGSAAALTGCILRWWGQGVPAAPGITYAAVLVLACGLAGTRGPLGLPRMLLAAALPLLARNVLFHGTAAFLTPGDLLFLAVAAAPGLAGHLLRRRRWH